MALFRIDVVVPDAHGARVSDCLHDDTPANLLEHLVHEVGEFTSVETFDDPGGQLRPGFTAALVYDSTHDPNHPKDDEPATLTGVVTPIDRSDEAAILAASIARHPATSGYRDENVTFINERTGLAEGQTTFPLVIATVIVKIPISTDDNVAGALADTLTNYLTTQLSYGQLAQFIQNTCRRNGVEPVIEVTT